MVSKVTVKKWSVKKNYKIISSNITVKIVLLDEQSQLLLGEISACTNTSAEIESTNKSVTEKGKKRLRVKIHFTHMSRPICRMTFLFLHGYVTILVNLINSILNVSSLIM